ncbi:DNA ligase D [Pedobacter cryophilus]|uniref:DNA ligase (ATP) n=1 Tax=Pedobacter cryophilus TaxID=2571271 RepID=A0A4U1BYD3_9SPHI|nr:DNA ligase D [Pedobacter cryophilus]TKB97579.1 DNA ligase D [Pedobacter cryophilus]
MNTKTYDEKRDFTNTSEPKFQKSKPKKGLKFVVQRHDASHLHYDFRLEMGGVLKSWAIPKGPSLNPKDKRLAVMVEDHPYEYRTFEGEIPKGNYGAGTVYIFDEGEYESLQQQHENDEEELLKGLETGSLKFRLKGKILKGEFALVKIKSEEQNSWLLIKHQDKFAVADKFDIEKLIPKEIIANGKAFKKKVKNIAIIKNENLIIEKTKHDYKPMLAKLSSAIFDEKDWFFERKLDGYRIIAYTGETVELLSRNGIKYTENFKSISEELNKIKEIAVLDGEIIAENDDGEHQFQWLQNYLNGDKTNHLKYFVFDLLSLNGNDITHLTLVKRKELLAKLLSNYSFSQIFYHPHLPEKGIELFEKAKKEKWEGIIAKKANDVYYAGKRTNSWLKFKLNNSQDAIICGYTALAGSRKYFGALVLGVYDKNNELKYIGNCGTGFNDQKLKDIYGKLSVLKTDNKPFKEKVNQEKNVTWVTPQYVCEVNYAEWTKDGLLRHPVFKGLRIDKTPSEVMKEEKIESNDFPEKANEEERIYDGKKVKLTNVLKVFWKKEGYTKGDLIHYYEAVADYILPFLMDKPLSLNRHPNGAEEPSFFQKDVEVKHLPSWAKTAVMHSESNNKDIDYLVCNDKASLIYMANLGCIEINPWLSSYKKPDHPEFMVIDLDPDGNPFTEVVEVALAAKLVLDEMDITSFIKTSGSTGLHIYIYLAAEYEYSLVRKFAEYIANKVNENLPELTSVVRSPAKRKGLIYLDFMQNNRGQTIAAPYSVRPKPGATVSMPLKWDEVNEHLDFHEFNIVSVPKIIKQREDHWKDIKMNKTDLSKALKQMDRISTKD